MKLQLSNNNKDILKISKALSSPERLKILEILNTSSKSIKELHDILGIPMSTTSLHVNILEECDLISVLETYTKVGKSKLCSRNVDNINIDIFRLKTNTVNKMDITIPIGNYTSYDVPPGGGCGIATKDHTIGVDNDPDVFFNEERFKAGYIWFNQGFLHYRIPNKTLPSKINRLKLSFEICSEAPFYRNDWKSDITFSLCDKEVGIWTSPGDFGGRRGKNNPRWWSDAITQFGMLVNLDIREDGTYANDEKISNVTINDLDIKKESYIPFSIGVKKDAKYCGGLSLFGKTFGDYDQDIIVTFYW